METKIKIKNIWTNQSKDIKTELDVFFHLVLICLLSYLFYYYSIPEFDLNSVKNSLMNMVDSRQKKANKMISSFFILAKKNMWITNSSILLTGEGNIAIEENMHFVPSSILSGPIKNAILERYFLRVNFRIKN